MRRAEIDSLDREILIAIASAQMERLERLKAEKAALEAERAHLQANVDALRKIQKRRNTR